MTTPEVMVQMVATAPGTPDVLQATSKPLPDPGEGEVRITMEAAGVAFGDVLLRQGLTPGRFPALPGYDVIGHVSALGSAVGGFALGDRVAALPGAGGYATEVIAPAAVTVPVPEDLDTTAAASLTLNYLTAWQLLHRAAQVRAGQRILVLGAAGGVGSALVELAGLSGVHVLGTASAHRHSALAARGVEVIADPAAITEPVDAVLDPVGGPSLAASQRACKRDGVLVSYGASFLVGAGHSRAGGLVRAVAAMAMAKLRPGARLVSYSVMSQAKKHPDHLRADLTRLLELLQRGAITPVTMTMPLTDAAAAHRKLEARQVTGKLVLTR